MRQDINRKIIDYLIKYKPNRIGIFGSYARNEENFTSDIDILVDFSGKITLFDLGGIKYDLTDILKRPVDIVTERGLNNKLRDTINKDLKIIYSVWDTIEQDLPQLKQQMLQVERLKQTKEQPNCEA